MHTSGRHGAALLLCGAVLLMPLLLIQSQPDASASPAPDGQASAVRATALRSTAPRPARAGADHLTADVRARTGTRPTTRAVVRSTPSTGDRAARHRAVGGASLPWTAPVETTLPSQEVAQHIALATAPAPVTTTTSTTSPTAPSRAPVTTTTTAPPAPVPSVHASQGYGQVTYYDHPAGTCASPWLPFGTVVRITNPATGATVSCVVNDREADTERSIDLATGTFALLAPLSQGVVDAELSW